MALVTLYGTPNQYYVARDNAVYLADGNGKIQNVDEFYEDDLIAKGCMPEAMWLLLNAAHSTTGLPAGGTAGQLLTNTAPGQGSWQNAAADVDTDVDLPAVVSDGTGGELQMADGAGGFAASQVVDNGTSVSIASGVIMTPIATPITLISDTGIAFGALSPEGQDTLNAAGVFVNDNPLSGSGTIAAVAGAATLNTQNGIVTSEPLVAASSYVLTLTNSVILAGSTVLVNAYDGTNTWLPISVVIAGGSAVISLATAAPVSVTITIAFAVFN
jgi:hypothetical protein